MAGASIHSIWARLISKPLLRRESHQSEAEGRELLQAFRPWHLPEERLRPRQEGAPPPCHQWHRHQMNPVSDGHPWCRQPLDYPVPKEIQDERVSEERPPTAAKILDASSSNSAIVVRLQAPGAQRWTPLPLTKSPWCHRQLLLCLTHLHSKEQEMDGMLDLVFKVAQPRRQHPFLLLRHRVSTQMAFSKMPRHRPTHHSSQQALFRSRPVRGRH